MSILRNRQAALGLGVLVVFGAVVIGTMSGAIGRFLDREDTRTVTAVFADAQQLRKGSVVRVDGVDSGQVRSIVLDPGGRTSTVTMHVADQAGPLYADARAVLRFKTVLGGSFYLDLDRGTPGRGGLSATIPVERTARQVELDDITPAFGGGARKGLQTLPGETRDALSVRDAPKGTLKALADVAPSVTAGVGALRGQDLDRDLRGLVRNAAQTTQALDRPTAQLQGLVSGAAVTLQTVAARRAELQQTLRLSPPTADVMTTTLRRLEDTLDRADPLVDELRGPAGEVAPTLQHLRPVAVDADRLLQRAVPLLRALSPAARSLAGVATRGLPLVRQLEPSLRRVDETLLPMLAEKDPGTDKSTAVMIGGSFASLGSGAGGQTDSSGHFIRFPATSGSSPVASLPCQLYINNPDSDRFAACQDLATALSAYLNYNPLGATAGAEPPAGGSR